MSDQMMSEDQIVGLIAAALMVAHIGVLIWYWLRRDLTPVLWLNLLVSGGVMVYWAPRLGELFHYVDIVSYFVAFEVAVLAAGVAVLAGVRVPRALTLLFFAGNAGLCAFALYFMATFTITRLI